MDDTMAPTARAPQASAALDERPTRGPYKRLRATARIDIAIACALVLPALLLRHGSLPTDGLYHDDAWVAASAISTTPAQMLTSSVDHPLFTVLLASLRPLAHDATAVLTYPAWVIGSMLPSALFLFLRRMGYARSVALPLAAIVVVAPAAVGLSGRVKTYVFDALIVVIIAYALSRISERRWTRLLALGWFLAMVTASAFSIFALIACAVAGVVIVLHPCRDLRVRVAAVGAQAVVVGTYFLASRTRYDTEALRQIWAERSDTYIGFDPNPLRMLASVWQHVVDVVGVYPGGPAWVTQLCAAAATFGLIVAALRPRAIVARFFLLVVVVAVVGSIARQFPFGADQTVSSARTALWFLPVTAYGLAEAATVALRRLPLTGPASRTAAAISYAGVALLFLSALAGPPAYELRGSASAAAALEAQRRPGDVVLLNAVSAFPLAVESDIPADFVSDTSSVTGLRVVFNDKQVTDVFGHENVGQSVLAHVCSADRVLEFRAFTAVDQLGLVNKAMLDAGFERSGGRQYQHASITEWTRSDSDDRACD